MLGAYGAGWDYLGLKGVVEKLLETARVADARFARNTAGTSYHPGRCADIWLGEDKLGTIGEVHPAVLANYGVKPRVVAAELRMDVLLDVYKRQVLNCAGRFFGNLNKKRSEYFVYSRGFL